jgi:hypothetical protein
MDSDWRNSTNGREGYYNYPNTSAFANYSEWSEYLREHKVHLAFIDHSFPHYINGTTNGTATGTGLREDPPPGSQPQLDF